MLITWLCVLFVVAHISVIHTMNIWPLFTFCGVWTCGLRYDFMICSVYNHVQVYVIQLHTCRMITYMQNFWLLHTSHNYVDYTHHTMMWLYIYSTYISKKPHTHIWHVVCRSCFILFLIALCTDSMLFWYCLSAQFHTSQFHTYIVYMTCSIANHSSTIYICWSHDYVCCLSLHTFHSYILWLSAPCSRSVDGGLVDCAMTAGSVVCTIMYKFM